jgi:hypothetical protein
VNRRRRDESGWVLFDVLIGAIVLTAGLVGVTLAFNQSQQSTARVGAHDEAVAIASTVLSEATAYGCGEETGLSLPGAPPTGPAPGYPYTATLWQQCAAVYAGRSDAPFPGSLGDPVDAVDGPGGARAAWRVTSDGTEFSVSYRASWVPGGATGGCPAATGSRSAGAPEPIGQTRTITVAWEDHGAVVTFATTAFGGVPIDAVVYASPDAGGIVVTGMAPGSMARLAVPVGLFAPGLSGTVLVDRAASAGGCAWFPFLAPAAPGTYTVWYYAGGAAGGPPTATTPATLAVTAGSLVRWAA